MSGGGIFSQGCAVDGPVILKLGAPLTPEEIVDELNWLYMKVQVLEEDFIYEREKLNARNTKDILIIGKLAGVISAATWRVRNALSALGKADNCTQPACPQCRAVKSLKDAIEVLEYE